MRCKASEGSQVGGLATGKARGVVLPSKGLVIEVLIMNLFRPLADCS